MPEITITVPYRANALSSGAAGWSENHFKVGSHRASALTPEAKGTRDTIIWQIQNAIAKSNWIPVAPLSVDIQGTFQDSRSCIDLSNSVKLVSDAVQSATGVNDKRFKVSTGLPRFDRNVEPVITIKVTQL